MYPKHLNQTNRTMNVTIEHVFCRYSDEAEEIYFRIMNTILFATDETELRASMERLKNETTLDDYFIFGYGALRGRLTSGVMTVCRFCRTSACCAGCTGCPALYL